MEWVTRVARVLSALDPTGLARQLGSYRLPGVQFSPFEFDFNRKPADGQELRRIGIQPQVPRIDLAPARHGACLQAWQR